ncbi:MAG: peptidoglycan-binding protein [Devosiaceae bacterium]|nr:peptidoglycan-binding protein [Devosiaceae bacterium]
MTSSTFQQLPFSATSSLLGATKRTLGWAMALFMNNPLQNIAIALLTTAMAISFSNALFWQTGVHPAPIFSLQQQALSASGENFSLQNASAPHPRQLSASRIQQPPIAALPVSQPIPQPVSTQSPVLIDRVTNEILAQAQTMLAEIGLFSGKVDGYYGPLTAEAIRAFERQQGLTVKGSMSPEIIGKILSFKAGQTSLTTQSAPAALVPDSLAPVSSAPVPSVVSAPVLSQPVVQQAQAANTQPHIDEQGQTVPDLLRTIASSVRPSQSLNSDPVVAAAPAYDTQSDKQLIEKIQRGLSSLGFYYSSIDGVLGETTARAIREFENFKSFEMTGRISSQLLIWLQEAGAIT